MSQNDVRKEINVYAFKHDRLPKALCEKYPELWDIGLYRKKNNGKEEVISYCHKTVETMTAFQDEDIQKMLDKWIPKKKEKQ